MLSIESVIYIIQYCLNESLQDCSFEQGSYLKWTVNELLDRLRENPEVTPLIIIKDFRNQMEEYSKVSPWDIVNTMLDGKLTPYIQRVIDGDMTSKDLANALKTAINSVYGLTSASFANPFKDPRNIDNIVAKRGALFMIDLKNEVLNRGFQVAHIKTDSIKIPDATPEIIQFVMYSLWWSW